jgi:hypothetical protein
MLRGTVTCMRSRTAPLGIIGARSLPVPKKSSVTSSNLPIRPSNRTDAEWRMRRCQLTTAVTRSS